MKRSNLFRLLVLLVIASMALTACGGGKSQPAATGAPTSGGTNADGIKKITSTGFECPEP